jgi:hypothetical protein
VSTIVAVMDRAGFAANTDILVLAQPEARRLLWVPRDLWCDGLRDRINTAYAAGGAAWLIAALAEHGLAAQQCLCLSREATEAALAGARVIVPVPAPMEFDYPLSPTQAIEEGSKRIRFNPPFEVLTGERIHQWLGARGGSDLHRLERQKVFLRRLLERGFDFRQFVANPRWVQHSDASALAEVAQVRPDWAFETLPNLSPRRINGKLVLVRDMGTLRPPLASS